MFPTLVENEALNVARSLTKGFQTGRVALRQPLHALLLGAGFGVTLPSAPSQTQVH